MPLYDFNCGICGSFGAFRSIAQRHEPMACPGCGAQVQRTIVAPNLALLGSGRRFAHARNERSCHEPAVTASKCPANGAGSPQQPRFVAGRSRPWMLGH